MVRSHVFTAFKLIFAILLAVHFKFIFLY